MFCIVLPSAADQASKSGIVPLGKTKLRAFCARALQIILYDTIQVPSASSDRRLRFALICHAIHNPFIVGGVRKSQLLPFTSLGAPCEVGAMVAIVSVAE